MPYVAQEQICLDEARKKIVPCDSPEARSNLALPGAELTDEVAKQYGLMDADAGKAKAAATDEEEATVSTPKPQQKTVENAPANKAKDGAANK